MIEIVLLSIVQGITEFLPVSSTLHLLIFSHLINDYQINLLLVSGMHIGSLIAVLIFFAVDSKLKIKQISYRQIMQIILVGTLPILVVGFILYDFIDQNMSINPLVIASTFTFGVLLFIADKYSKSGKKLNGLKFFDLIIIGIFQCFALIPGASRSATTIISSRFLQIDREASIVISVLLSFPAMIGAFTLALLKTDIGHFDFSMILQGVAPSIIFSFLSSYLALKLFYRYSSSNGFGVFAAYRVLLAIFLVFN
mgnify:CR=1 FL=1